MNDRIMQFRVGVVVLATSIIGAILVTLNGPSTTEWVPWTKGTYQVTIELLQAPGIGPNTPIRKNGLLIGRVQSIDDLDDRVAVHAAIDSGHRLFPQYICQVRTSVLGDATIEFVATPVPPGTPPLPDGAVVQGVVVGNPLDLISNLQDDLQVAIHSLTRAGDEVAKLAQTVNEAVGDDTKEGRVSQLIDKTELAMDQFSRAAQTVDQFFGDQETQNALRETRITMRDFRQAISEIRSATASAERNLNNLEKFTAPLGEQGEEVASSLVLALEGLGQVVEELTVLTGSLNSRDGTLGQLIHNRELYDNINRVLVNSNHLVLRLNDLSMRLRPILDDARVFLDKIAREPGRLIGGAFSNGPGIK
jgi:phospholipid/cholesterol/gamma-HCH transport system substrate-binding protein